VHQCVVSPGGHVHTISGTRGICGSSLSGGCQVFWSVSNVCKVGDAAVFVEPPAASTCYPNRATGIAGPVALIDLRSMQSPNSAAPRTSVPCHGGPRDVTRKGLLQSQRVPLLPFEGFSPQRGSIFSLLSLSTHSLLAGRAEGQEVS